LGYSKISVSSDLRVSILGITRRAFMFAEGRIPLWIVGVVAGLGVIAVVGLFFYGAYAGLGSSM
jgi:photosystem II PsbJ protein